MVNIFTFDYWFMMQPLMFVGWASVVLLVLFTAMTVLGIAGIVYGMKANLDKFLRRAVERSGSLLVTMGLVGLMLYFFAYERVPMLSMRIWYIMWLAILGFWAWGIWRYVRVEIPAKREMKAERDRLNKWLPKAKK